MLDPILVLNRTKIQTMIMNENVIEERWHAQLQTMTNCSVLWLNAIRIKMAKITEINIQKMTNEKTWNSTNLNVFLI